MQPVTTHLVSALREAVQGILRFFGKYYAADPRALSLLRIGVALALISDLLIRFPDIGAHYSDAGTWPRALALNFGWQRGYWSLHALNGSIAWQQVLFALHLTAAIMLLAGYRTRTAAFVCWTLLVSLHNRNVFILQGGDDLLRLTMFWGIFLPWNARYSLDARNTVVPAANPVVVFGYFALLASVYLFGFVLKTGNDWWEDGSAVYYALSLDQMRLPAGDILYASPALMTALTRTVLFTELLIATLILWPSRNGATRMAAFLLIVILHAGIGLTLYVGLFFAIGMVTALGLVPAGFLSKVRLTRDSELQSPSGKQGVLLTVFAATVTTLCLVINLSSVVWWPFRLHGALGPAVNALRLGQQWAMFSPGVLRNDGWLLAEGIDSSGTAWDLRHDRPAAGAAAPGRVTSIYSSDRWRKLSELLQDGRYTFLRPLYAAYLHRDWNRRHPGHKMSTVNLYVMEKRNLPAYRHTPLKKQLLWVSHEH